MRSAARAAQSLVIVALVGLSGCSSATPGRDAAPPHRTQLPPRLPVSSGATFYVATDGADANPGTRKAPWRTVQKALDTLHAGQTALVRAGVYAQNLVMTRAGTVRAPITIKNYPGERPVLHPSPSSPSWPLRLTTGAAYARIQGFVIEDAEGERKMNVVGLGSDPGAHDWEIADCEIRGARNSSGMFVDDTNRNVWIVGNRIHGNNEPGVQHQGIYLESKHSVITGNVVYNQTNGFGIQVRAGASHVTVANNTVAEVSLSGIVVENTADHVTVVNNISAFNDGYGIRGLDEGGVTPEGNTAFNNLLYGNREGSFGNSNGRVIDFLRAGNVFMDPGFVDRGRSDYHLTPASNALGRALPEWSPYSDWTAHRGKSGERPDLGAYPRSG